MRLAAAAAGGSVPGRTVPSAGPLARTTGTGAAGAAGSVVGSGAAVVGGSGAVVAVAAGNAEPQDSDRTVPPSPWHGLPVFSAWVAGPEDAAAD